MCIDRRLKHEVKDPGVREKALKSVARLRVALADLQGRAKLDEQALLSPELEEWGEDNLPSGELR